MNKRVYIETTIVSYLTAKPSRDLILAAQQELTREWWHSRRDRYDLYTSQIVLDEAGKGEPELAAKRLLMLQGMLLVAPLEAAIELADGMLSRRVLPAKAATDALHLAVATVHRMNVLLTWNCTHLANASLLVDIGRYLRAAGYEAPIVCTPNELMGDPGKLRG